MKSFLLALGFIACFILGGYTSFRFCEHFNRMLRGQRPRPRRAEPDIFDIDERGSKVMKPVLIEKHGERHETEEREVAKWGDSND